MHLIGVLGWWLSVVVFAARCSGRDIPVAGSIDGPPRNGPPSRWSRLPRSCRDVAPRVSGVFRIQPDWPFHEPVLVYCDQEYEDGGWTVIQRRIDGTVDFDQFILDYVNGFGDLESEFWLGLQTIYRLTKSAPHEIVVLLEDFAGNTSYARSDTMRMISTHRDSYTLERCNFYTDSAGNEFNIVQARFECRGNGDGCWVNTQSNPNGKYPSAKQRQNPELYKGLYWKEIKGGTIKSTKIMIRPTARKD